MIKLKIEYWPQDEYEASEQLRALKRKFGTPETIGKEMVAVITLTKLSEGATEGFYSFHFEKKGAVEVGQVQHLDDGSVRLIEFIWE